MTSPPSVPEGRGMLGGLPRRPLHPCGQHRGRRRAVVCQPAALVCRKSNRGPGKEVHAALSPAGFDMWPLQTVRSWPFPWVRVASFEGALMPAARSPSVQHVKPRGPVCAAGRRSTHRAVQNWSPPQMHLGLDRNRTSKLCHHLAVVEG